MHTDCFPEISCETLVVENEAEIMQKLLDGTCTMALFSQAQQNKNLLSQPQKHSHSRQRGSDYLSLCHSKSKPGTVTASYTEDKVRRNVAMPASPFVPDNVRFSAFSKNLHSLYIRGIQSFTLSAYSASI